MAKQRRQPISFESESEPITTTTPTEEPQVLTGKTIGGQPEQEETEVAAASPPPPAAAAATAVAAEQSPFQEMLVKEYHAALDKQIATATNKVMERFTRLMSQERSPDDVQKDALGNSSDFYENLVTAVQTGDPRIGKTKEEVYDYLFKLNFTGMRDIAAIKQEYQQQA